MTETTTDETNREIRIEKLREIKGGEPISSEKIRWRDESVTKKVYRIPLRHLLFNQYNGRIQSRVLSHEKSFGEINPETSEGRDLIKDFLWESKPGSNSSTQADLRRKGQMKNAIVTADGVIIDGNRRSMLLEKIGESHLNAVILPVCIADDPIEIQKFEVEYQMGEDAKLDYNPIEKYLKINQMLKDGAVNEEKLSELMGITVAKIQEHMRTFKEMERYLETHDYEGIYVALDKREDPLISLAKWREQFESGRSRVPFRGHTQSNVEELMEISHAFIRFMYASDLEDKPDPKQFRILATGKKLTGSNLSSHFFGNESIWNSFNKSCQEVLDDAEEQAESFKIADDVPDIKIGIDNADKEYAQLVDSRMVAAFNNAKGSLKKKTAIAKPKVRLEEGKQKIRDVLGGIRPNSPEIEGVKEKLIEIVETVKTAVGNTKDPLVTLQSAMKFLEGLDLNTVDQSITDDVKSLLKEIEKKSFAMGKEL
jgi:hypothetical protein